MHATLDHNGQDWDAPELGTPKAAAIALLLMALLFGLAMWASTEFKNKPALQAIQVTQASLTPASTQAATAPAAQGSAATEAIADGHS